MLNHRCGYGKESQCPVVVPPRASTQAGDVRLAHALRVGDPAALNSEDAVEHGLAPPSQPLGIESQAYIDIPTVYLSPHKVLTPPSRPL